VLAGVGTAAMVWVGGGILVHGLGELGAHGPEHVIHTLAVAAGNGLPALGGLVTWLVEAACYGVVGLAAGGLLIPLVSRVVVPAWRALRGR
jgi:predicted DNA repair protein MutK